MPRRGGAGSGGVQASSMGGRWRPCSPPDLALAPLPDDGALAGPNPCVKSSSEPGTPTRFAGRAPAGDALVPVLLRAAKGFAAGGCGDEPARPPLLKGLLL